MRKFVKQFFLQVPRLFLPLRATYAFYWCISLIAGILCSTGYYTTGFLLLGICAINRITDFCSIIVLFILFSFGWWRTIAIKKTYEKARNQIAQSFSGKGIITQIDSDDKNEQKITIKTYALKNDTWIKAKTTLILSTKKSLGILPGNHVYFSFYPYPSPEINSNLETMTIKNSVDAHGRLSKIEVLPDSHFFKFYKPILEQIESIKKKLNAEYNKYFSRDTKLFFESIFLGDNMNMKEDLSYKKYFQDWGVAHYLARSGLHVMLIFSFIFFIFALLKISYTTILIPSIGIITIFTFLSKQSMTFMRAYITAIIILFLRFFKISASNLHIFLLCTLFFLIYNPYYFFSLDFQLSFGATWILIWKNHLTTIERLEQIKN